MHAVAKCLISSQRCWPALPRYKARSGPRYELVALINTSNIRVGVISHPALVVFLRQTIHSRRVMPSFTPRLLRMRHAPTYLGMNKNAFNVLVRPNVRVIALGRRGIAFDRLELDAWAEEYCRRNGRPAPEKEGQLCRSEHQDFIEGPRRGARNGTSTNGSNTMDAFARALELTMKKKPNATWKRESGRSAKP